VTVAYTFPAREDCSLCRYVRGELSCEPIVSTAHAMALLNIRPRAEGSILVVPRRHARLLSDLAPAEAQHLMALVRESVRALRGTVRPDGVHVWWSAGTVAAQSEPHLHVQVVPRHHDAPYTFAPSQELPVAPADERRRMAARLRGSLRDRAPAGEPPASTGDGCAVCTAILGEREGRLVETERVVAAVPWWRRSAANFVVVTRRHVPHVTDLDAAALREVTAMVQSLTQRVEAELRPAGLHTWFAEDPIADQEWPHLMVELVARFPDVPYRFQLVAAAPRWEPRARQDLVDALRAEALP
jgi:histidine triad (HIT) family protein